MWYETSVPHLERVFDKSTDKFRDSIKKILPRHFASDGRSVLIAVRDHVDQGVLSKGVSSKFLPERV